MRERTPVASTIGHGARWCGVKGGEAGKDLVVLKHPPYVTVSYDTYDFFIFKDGNDPQHFCRNFDNYVLDGCIGAYLWLFVLCGKVAYAHI